MIDIWRDRIVPHAIALAAALVMSELLLAAFGRFNALSNVLVAFALPLIFASVAIPDKKYKLLWLILGALPVLLVAPPPRRFGLTIGDILIFGLAATLAAEKLLGEDRSWRWQKTIFTWPLLCLLAVALGSAVLSQDMPLALSDIIENVRYLLFYIIFINLVRTKAELKRACQLLLLGFIPCLFLGFAQYYLGFGLDFFADALPNTGFGEGGLDVVRVYGPFAESLAFAQYLLVPMFLAAGLGFHARTPAWTVAFAGLFGFGGVLLVLTLTRGSWVALLIALAAVIALRMRVRSIAYLTIAAGVALAAIIGYWDFLAPLVPESVADRLSALSSDFDVGRGLSWRAALSIVADHPLFGIGLGNLYHMLPYYAPSILSDPLWLAGVGLDSPRAGLTGFTFHMHVDSFYVTLFAELGILGMIPLAWLFFRAIARAVVNYRHASADLKPYALGIAGALVALSVSMTTAYTYSDIRLALLLWLLFAMTVVLQRLVDGDARS